MCTNAEMLRIHGVGYIDVWEKVDVKVSLKKLKDVRKAAQLNSDSSLHAEEKYTVEISPFYS